MNFTKEQISELMCKHAQRENGLHDLLEIMIESMMVAECGEFLAESRGNKGNGFRPGHTYGHGRRLEFRIPRDHYGNFHPQILAILRDQEDDCERLAGSLYTKGLTQEQVGEVFEEFYGDHYSKASISQMLEYVRKDVGEWLERSLEEYYPVVFVDCIHIKIHRKRAVACESDTSQPESRYCFCNCLYLVSDLLMGVARPGGCNAMRWEVILARQLET